MAQSKPASRKNDQSIGRPQTYEESEIQTRRDAIEHVDQNFRVSETVARLHSLMGEVTKTEITPDTVNAACNCVQNLNVTIKTAIQAAKFIKSGR